MKWVIEDEGSFDAVWIREAESGPEGVIGRPICRVFPPTPAFEEPTPADREAMLDTARQIVEAHNSNRLTWLLRCEAAIKSLASQIVSPDTTAEDMVNDILGDKPRRKGRATR